MINIAVMKNHKGHICQIIEVVVHNAKGKFSGYALHCVNCDIDISHSLRENPDEPEKNWIE